MPSTTSRFVSLLENHAALVFRALTRFGVRPCDVEDVAQDVFTIALRKFEGFEGRSSESTWLYGIAQRVAADYRRRAWVRLETPLDATWDQAVDEEATSRLERQELAERLHAALSCVQRAQRETLVLFELEELPMADVAKRTGVPVQTAYARLYAARKRMRAVLTSQRRDSGTRGQVHG